MGLSQEVIEEYFNYDAKSILQKISIFLDTAIER